MRDLHSVEESKMAERRVDCTNPDCRDGQVKCPNLKCGGRGGWEGISGGVPTWETCTVCWGKRTVDCTTCKGYGYLYVYVSE